MKNLKTPLVALSIFFALSSPISAQQTAGKSFPQKCYAYDRNGDVRSMTELENMFVSTEEREIEDEFDKIRIDTLIINKRLGDNEFVISRKGGAGYGLVLREILEPDAVAVFNAPIRGTTIEEVEKKYAEGGFVKHANLQTQYVYSETKKNEIEKAPGLDEITREDLIKSLSWRKEIGEMLKTMVEENPDLSRFRVRSYIEEYRKLKLVMLGYNPYKQVEYNWQKKFADDEEIIKLLTKTVSFD